MELSTLPEYVVVETTEHKCLQSQFSVLYNEAMQLKTQLEENRAQLSVSKNAHMRQVSCCVGNLFSIWVVFRLNKWSRKNFWHRKS